jgi:hypothetical protein
MRCFLWTLVFSLLLISHSSFAEFYKYRDENGVVRYTDNPLEIPKDQQENVEAYREIKVLEAAGEAAKVESMDDIGEKLRAQKMILDKEYQGLVAERQQLEQEDKIDRTGAEHDAFQKKIVDFNLRLQQYEEKRLLFKEKADTYNEARAAQFK